MNIFKKLTSLFSTNKSPNNTHELGLNISSNLKQFLENEVLPGLGINADSYWQAFEQIIDEFSPRNKNLLNIREEIQ
jgi:malate synthase